MCYISLSVELKIYELNELLCSLAIIPIKMAKFLKENSAYVKRQPIFSIKTLCTYTKDTVEKTMFQFSMLLL